MQFSYYDDLRVTGSSYIGIVLQLLFLIIQTPNLSIARMITRLLQFFAAMLITLLGILSYQPNSHVYGEFVTHRPYRSSGAGLRSPSSHETIEHDILSLERSQRELGTRFQRCGDSVVFCLISEVCRESGSPSKFTCKHTEETVATANSPRLSPTQSPTAVEAPVAVSTYWDDPKANSSTVVVTSRAAITKWGDDLAKAGGDGMRESYDPDGDGSFNLTPIFCVFAVVCILGLICVCMSGD